MKVLLVRHGQSEADILNVHEGRADFPLTSLGEEQATKLGLFLASNYQIDKIYSSPLKRAKSTALHISDSTNIPVIFDDNLMEFNNGLLAGLSREEANRLYPEIKDLPVDKAVYGQESKVEFRQRAEAFVKRLMAENPAESTIVVVSHGGMINQIFGYLFDMPIGKNYFIGTSDTGFHLIKIEPERSMVIFTNCTVHLN